MFYRRWNALGTTLAAAAMLLGCGGDSDPSNPAPEAHLAAAPEPVLAAPEAAVTAAPAQPPAPLAPPIPAVAAIRTPPAPLAPPIPAIPAIFIPAIPSVAAITPSSPASALTSTSSNQAANSGPAPADDFSGKKMIVRGSAGRAQSRASQDQSGSNASRLAGFANFSGNHCYANAALKVLIHTLGSDRLRSHLMAFCQNSPPLKSAAEIAAAHSFMQLITRAESSNVPVHTELHDFLTRLQSLQEFDVRDVHGNYRFGILSHQQDADVFLKKISDLFDLSLIPGGISTTISTLTNGQENRTQMTAPESSRQIWLLSDGMGLQELMNTINSSEAVQVRWREGDKSNTPVVKSTQIAVADIQQFGRLAIQIVALNPSHASKLDLDQTVTLAVFDQKTSTQKMVTLEARAVCAHRGPDGAGHYMAYLKEDDKKWTLHDDSTTRSDSTIRSGEFPKMIVFAVTHVKDA